MIALDPIVATGLPHSAQLHPPIQYVAILKTEQFAPEQPNRVANILQQVPRLHPNEKWAGEVESARLTSEEPTPIAPWVCWMAFP